MSGQPSYTETIKLELQLADLQSQLTQRTAEFQRHDGELQQICGQALDYPWFKDDQKNFPGATEKDGVCVGEHVGITIAQELANAYRKRTAELEAVNKKREDTRKAFLKIHESFNDQSNKLITVKRECDNLQAELERVRGERDKLALCGHDHSTQWWQVRYEELAALVAALPKVEGEIMVSESLVLAEDPDMCSDMSDKEEANAYAAILKHRQGMEG